jgi:hypothetical protein
MQLRDGGAREIFDGIDSKAARRTLPHELHVKAADLLDLINAPYRICFIWNEGEAQSVEIVDYH